MRYNDYIPFKYTMNFGEYMKITREIDYAFRIMNCLAENSGTPAIKGINAPAISFATGIPVKFTLKILNKLKSNALVRSFKGSSGGFALNRDPSEITLLDILEAIDGPVVINSCLEDNCDCSRIGFDKKNCFYYHVFGEINRSISDRLRSITLDRAIHK